MLTFLKAQVASLTASLVDYLSTMIGVEVFGLYYVWSSICGTVIGGVTNFSMGRVWVFEATEKKAPAQMFKYLLVWTGNLALTTSGVYIVTHYVGLSYIVSKIAVSILVGFFYNYLLQKKFVFK